MTYLAYDLKGIQSFIFSVPRLKYICGGSAIIDRFDREVAPDLARDLAVPGARLLFSGGGKGAFRCESASAAEAMERSLVNAAQDDGLSISIGIDTDLGEASQRADRSFTFLPRGSELEGHPCPASGLYPTNGGVHPKVRRRVWNRGDRLDRRYERELLDGLGPVGGLHPERCDFFHDVTPGEAEGDAACAALGRRNRWAVIAMDGNDIGSQHAAAASRLTAGSEKHAAWLEVMSRALDDCTRAACREGIRWVVSAWANEGIDGEATAANGITTLPVRPLVVGGDDVIVLLHVRFAMGFVRAVCGAFERESREQATKAAKAGVDLWPATGGTLSISAGVLFAPVSLPLASAIPYAEGLLASAKGEGRKHQLSGQRTPPCVDWESVTEGLLDQPHTRRQRELRFLDEDLDEIVELTRRPYTLEGFERLEALANRNRTVPGTIRQQLIGGLQAGYWDRQVFRARLGKHQRTLADDLAEDEKQPGSLNGRWRREQDATVGKRSVPVRSTDLLDAILLLEEDSRMRWETA